MCSGQPCRLQDAAQLREQADLHDALAAAHMLPDIGAALQRVEALLGICSLLDAEWVQQWQPAWRASLGHCQQLRDTIMHLAALQVGRHAGCCFCCWCCWCCAQVLCTKADWLQESIAAALCQLKGSGRVVLRRPPGALKPPIPIPSPCLGPLPARRRCAQPPC